MPIPYAEPGDVYAAQQAQTTASYLRGVLNNYADGTALSGAVVAAGGVVAQVADFAQTNGIVKVTATFSGNFGEGVLTPILRHVLHGGSSFVTDFAWVQNGNGEGWWSATVIVRGLVVGAAYDFQIVTTSGDNSLTLGQGSSAVGAEIIVEEMTS